MKRTILLWFLSAFATPAFADDPHVMDVRIEKAGMLWNIHVTVSHPDTGWDHYADGWRILDKDGNILAERELMHPHVEEQPFTRSISGVVLPDGTREVFVRTHCSVHGWSDSTARFELSP